MSLPGEHTSAPQVWPGHPPVPTWETPMQRIGRGGINLVDARDDLEPTQFRRMLNVLSTFGGPVFTRLGQTSLGTTSGGHQIHSLYRLNDPLNTSATRFVGSNTELYRGFSGVLTSLDAGYSGDPLNFCGLTMPNAGIPYVVVSDRSRQRKAQRTGAIEPFGIAPGLLTSTAIGTRLEAKIVEFDGGDPDGASNAAAWTMTAGTDRAGNAAGAPTAADVAPGVAFSTVVGGATGAYYSVVSIARSLDLSKFDTGETVEDEDMTFIQFNVSQPKYLEELTIYLVCSTFTAGNIPGKDAGNSQAYFKTFTPDEFIPFHDQQVEVDDASQGLRTRSLLQRYKDAASRRNTRGGSQEVISGITEESRLVTPNIPAGINVWGTYGILGIPLRRGDWGRVGTSEVGSPSWDTITGVVIVITANTNQPLIITSGDFWRIFGGSDPDTAEPDARAYDYRVINVHSLTGSKGNPSAIQVEANWLNPVRCPVVITPTASGITEMRQRAYRRGGGAATSTNWFFVGENNADGNPITDTSGDDVAVTEETLEIDNDQPVTSVNPLTGATILNQTLPIYFMAGDYCFGLGDPNQPGRLYRSKLGAPEQWPATEYQDVCATSEELMNGGAVATSGFVFSRHAMYSILTNADGTWTTEPTACREGLAARWALAVTPYGIAFVSPFGIKLTTGGSPDDLSSAMIGPLFRNETVDGMLPVSYAVPTALRLEYYQNELWFTYQDTGGTRRHLIYNFMDKTWRPYLFEEPCAVVYGDVGVDTAAALLLGGNATGQVYTHSGFTDDGAAIPYSFRTGDIHFGNPRNEKLLSEVVLDGDIQAATVNMTTRLNDETTVNTAQAATGTIGYRRYLFEPFGTLPQHARNVSVEFDGDAPNNAQLQFDKVGITYQMQPEVTFTQPSPWEELPGGEGYSIGMFITCDTGGVDKTADIEGTTNNGSIITLASLTINANGRRKLPFTWASQCVQQIRLRPTGQCEPWLRFKLEWLADPEPPRLIGWDTNWEDFGTKADKWLKGILLEADTLGGSKTVVLDIDQSLAAVNLGSLTFSGRTIQHLAFPKMKGRMFRLRAVDSTMGKVYGWQPIFDEEPLALTRWESEERPFPGMDGRWQKPLEAYICLRSTAQVSWTVTTYGSGTTALRTDTYTITSTGGVKRKARVPMEAAKGLLFSHLFTSASPFYLYREESEILIEDFNTGQARWVQVFIANDDLDPARTMGNAAVAAATPGGA